MILPACEYRRPHDDGRALCLSSIMQAPGQVVPLGVCARCRVRKQIVALRDPATIEPPPPPDAPAEEFVEAGPCVHRGELLRREKCRVCGMRDELAEVYGCALHGACTLRWRGVRGATSCLGCRDLETDD